MSEADRDDAGGELAPPGMVYEIGHWSICPASLEIKRPGDEWHLPEKKMQVLACLIEHAGKTVSREYLTTQVWSGNGFVAPKGINNAIWNLRRIFDDGIVQIETVPKQGYRLISTQAITCREVAPIATTVRGKAWNRVFPGLMALVGVVALYFLYFPAQPQRPELITHSQALPLELAFLFNPAISPDGQRIAYTGRTLDRFPDIHLYELNHPDQFQALTQTPDAERSPQWSPSGDAVAFLRMPDSNSCKVVVKSLQDGAETIIDDCHPSTINALAWSEKTGQLAYFHPRDHMVEVVVRNVASNRKIAALPVDQWPDIRNSLSWSPNGEWLAMSEHVLNAAPRIRLINVKQGQVTDEIISDGRLFGHDWYDDQHMIVASDRSGSYWLWLLDIVTREMVPLLTSPNFVGQPIYHVKSDLLAFHQQGFYSTLKGIEFGDKQAMFSVDTGASDVLPTPCGDGRLIFVSARTGSQQLWLRDVNAGESKALTPPHWQAYNPACDTFGQNVAFMGRCDDDKEDRLCLWSLANETLQVLGHITGISGFVQWDGDNLLVPVRHDNVSEVLRVTANGEISARYRLPFPAGLVRRHPENPSLFFSSSQHEGLWRLDLLNGESQRLPIAIANTHWALWDVTSQGLVFAQSSGDTNELVMQPWDEIMPRLHFALPDFQFVDNARLMWDIHQNRAWLTHNERVYTQLRLANINSREGRFERSGFSGRGRDTSY